MNIQLNFGKLALGISLVVFPFFLASCGDDEGFASDSIGTPLGAANGCEGVSYPDWETSNNVLPFPVGQSYQIGLSNCSGPPHSEGAPDQFGIEFKMSVGTLLTATRKGTIMLVEESGDDFSPTLNYVILRDEDGFFYHYQNLTKDGALVEEGDFVEQGDPIGLSGASGNAGAPMLRFVATRFGDWRPGYQTSYPITFRNTTANPKSLIQGETYRALEFTPED